MKQAFIYIFSAFLITFVLISIFLPLYKSTQKIKASEQKNPYSEIDFNVIKPLSAALETMSKEILIPQELSIQEIEKRYTKSLDLADRFPKAYSLYSSQCMSCHGPVGEGGKNLYSFDTRLNHRNTSYIVPPLRKNQEWNEDINSFFLSASKQNKPHLPKNLQTLEINDLNQLRQYLSQLTE